MAWNGSPLWIVPGTFVLISPVWGCLCPSALEMCQQYWQTEAVFVGRVASVERTGTTRRTRLMVTDTFRGIDAREVTFTSGTVSCSVEFQEGESYLVFAQRDRKTGELQTSVCSGTARVDRVPEHLQYIRGVKTGETRSRIFGHVAMEIPRSVIVRTPPIKPVPCVAITVRSNGREWRTTTSASGEYEVLDVPPGAYEVSAELPQVRAESRVRSGNLEAGACVEHGFLAVPTGSISGRLVDADGKPIARASIEILARSTFRLSDGMITDANGGFRRGGLELGEYVLAFHVSEPPNARDWYGTRWPYPGAYYPGVTDRGAAQAVRVEGGEARELEFRLPPRLREVVLRGRVKDEKGKPVKADVWLVDLDFPADKCQVDWKETGSDGVFSLTGAEGRNYAVFAHTVGRTHHVHSEVLERPEAAGKTLELVLSGRSEDGECGICRRFTNLWRAPLWGMDIKW